MFDFLSGNFVKRTIHRASAGCHDRFQFVLVNAHRALPAGKRAPRDEQSLARAVDLQHFQALWTWKCLILRGESYKSSKESRFNNAGIIQS